MNNPLTLYRRTQRELRRNFDAFTRENCPSCPTPCCRQPARILPTDILLAESTGWRSLAAGVAATSDPDEAAAAAGSLAGALHNPPDTAEAPPDAPLCSYLGDAGCTFPSDLRPFGCTAYICRYMYERLDRPALTRIKRLVRELNEQHQILMHSLHNSR